MKFAMLTPNPKQGFTLVEVMIVIVILSIFAGMMTLSVGGGESRRNKAFYEHLQSNINYLRLLSAEQMQPYGLAIKLAQNNQPSELRVVKLQTAASTNSPNSPSSLASRESNAVSWQLDNSVEPLIIPENVDVVIAPLDSVSAHLAAPSYLVGDQAPPVVWFGTGEATPVQITIKAKNGDASYLVDDPIVINAAGTIEPKPTLTDTNRQSNNSVSGVLP